MNEIPKKLRSLGFPAVCILLAVVAVLGVWMAGTEPRETEESGKEETVDAQSFRAEAVRQLQELLQGVEGVGEVRVMVTVETTPAKVYAENVKSSYEKTQTDYTGSSESQTVFAGENGKEKEPVLLYHQMPKIGGVAVVCRGAGTPAVRLKVTELVCGLFGIGANRVFVTN